MAPDPTHLTPSFHTEPELLEYLLHAATRGRRPLAFFVGAGLSLPAGPGEPGVPGAAEFVQRVRDELKGSAAVARIDQLATSGSDLYQHAFRELRGERSQDAANALVRGGVLEARKSARRASDPDPGRWDADWDAVERDLDGWELRGGPTALAGILKRLDRPLVVTTNFDPLLEIAVRRQGMACVALVHPNDASPDDVEVEMSHVRIVHLHGLWRHASTLHTGDALAQSRPKLKAWLRKLLVDCSVVVLGYGGWHDVFMEALGELIEANATLDLRWAFYESDPNTIMRAERRVLDRLTPAMPGGSIVLHRGIDVHALLPRVVERLNQSTRIHRADPSPYTPGPPIHTDEDFYGRQLQRIQLETAIKRRQPAQIIGERRTGKTSLLLWAERRIREWTDLPIARVHAAAIAGRTPRNLVLDAGRQLGRRDEVDQLLDSEGDETGPDRAICALAPLALLVDEADAITAGGTRFAAFLATCRGLTQDGSLLWISASTVDLHVALKDEGLVSAFLNDARPCDRVGPLEPAAAQALARRGLSEELARAAIVDAGRLPLPLQWLCELMWSCPNGGAHPSAQFDRDMAPHFARAWDRLDEDGRELVRRCANETSGVHVSSRDVRRADELVTRGILERADGRVRVLGEALRRFVRDA